MKKAEKGIFSNHSQKNLAVFSLLWLSACLIGTLLSYTAELPTKALLPYYLEALPKRLTLSFFQKDIWLLLISSARQELLFVLFLSIASCLNNGIHVAYLSFGARGFLFGIGASLCATQAPFPLFCTVLLKHVLLTATFLFFAASLFSRPFFDTRTTYTSKAFLLYSTFCEFGMSLLVQFLYVFILTKNQ